VTTSVPWKSGAIGFAMLMAATTSPGLAAQTAAERVASHGDWSVFVVANPRECYIVAQPSSSTARRDGRTVEVNRGDIRLFVRFNPGEGVAGEVSFTGGYPFDAGQPVKVEISSRAFNLTPGSGDANGWAWPAPSDDAPMVEAMRRGATATITGVSTRGTTTIDTVSLTGFTAAVNDASARCN
jgi:invasion protein IalB